MPKIVTLIENSNLGSDVVLFCFFCGLLDSLWPLSARSESTCITLYLSSCKKLEVSIKLLLSCHSHELKHQTLFYILLLYFFCSLNLSCDSVLNHLQRFHILSGIW